MLFPLLSLISIATFFKDKPCISRQSGELLSIGIREGISSVTLCPSFIASLYPEPSEPVRGYDFPPVAIITLSKLYSFSPFTVKVPSVFLITDFTFSYISLAPEA